MIDEKTRMAVALKRFSIISPILNGQVKNTLDYCMEVAKVVSKANELNISWPLDETKTDAVLEEMLFSKTTSAMNCYAAV